MERGENADAETVGLATGTVPVLETMLGLNEQLKKWMKPKLGLRFFNKLVVCQGI